MKGDWEGTGAWVKVSALILCTAIKRLILKCGIIYSENKKKKKTCNSMQVKYYYWMFFFSIIIILSFSLCLMFILLSSLFSQAKISNFLVHLNRSSCLFHFSYEKYLKKNLFDQLLEPNSTSLLLLWLFYYYYYIAIITYYYFSPKHSECWWKVI